jgi:glutamyl-tRNA synthetase
MRKLPPSTFIERIQPLVAAKFSAAKNDKDFERKAALIQGRITFFSEAPEIMQYFYEEPIVTVALLVNEKQEVSKEVLPKVFKVLVAALERLEPWTEETLKDALFKTAEKNNLQRGQLLWPLRVALTGLPYSPGAFEVAACLGKERTLERLKKSAAL